VPFVTAHVSGKINSVDCSLSRITNVIFFSICLVFCKEKMKHSTTNKYLATMDAEIIEQKGFLWHPQLHLSSSTVMAKYN
jgi:hypothetical protein